MRKTKIVCTIGPACRSLPMFEKLINTGMDVARINMSHENHEFHGETIDMLKGLRSRMEAPLAIMIDTKGPEIRIGNFEEEKVFLETGDEFILTTREVVGTKEIVFVNYADLPQGVTEGNIILIDDGHIKLSVLETTQTDIKCKILHGGKLSNRKGINVPDVHLDFPSLSEQDKSDLIFGIEKDVDFIAASFIRSREDVINIRKFLNYHGGHKIRIISKIENREGVNNFAGILEESDGVMVARGDMGVELEYQRLPGIQKNIIRKCYSAGKMVITATQMLDSMMNSPTPTRAEITDVANAVFDGTSAVMLSGETAAGKYPLNAVQVMAEIAVQAEEDMFEMRASNHNRRPKYEVDDLDITNAVCDAACRAADDLNVQAIVALTKSGLTARNTSKFRPRQSIIAVTPEMKTFHQLALSWGVCPVVARYHNDSTTLLLHAMDCAKQIDAVKKGDTCIIVAGVPTGFTANTNLLRIEVVS